MKLNLRVRAIIKEIIEIQERIALVGGVTQKELRLLKVMEMRLFEIYDMKFCNTIVELVFSYPGSQVLNIIEPCNVSDCDRLRHKVFQMYIAHSSRWQTVLWRNGKTIDINYKIDVVMENLYAINGDAFLDD